MQFPAPWSKVFDKSPNASLKKYGGAIGDGPAWRCVILTLLVLAALTGCNRDESHEPPRKVKTPRDGKPLIVASFFPVASLVEQIVGDAAIVNTFMPPGSNPHAYEPGAAQIAQISDADVLVIVGMNFDGWAERAGKSNGSKNLKTFEMAEMLGIEEPAGHDHDHAAGHAHVHDEKAPNMHLWMDPVLTEQFVEKLIPELSKIVQESQREAVEKRGAELIADLKKLDAEYQAKLSAVPNKELVTFHNAFDLSAKRYGLKVVAHLAELDVAPGGDVTPQQMADVIGAARKYHLQSLYAEPQFPRQAIEAIDREANLKLFTLDAEGDPAAGGYTTYQAMMRKNLEALTQGQSLVTGTGK